MLQELFIKDIILVEQAVIQFGKGFNVISGETGSGKSAILKALSLVLGARADHKLIRQGAKLSIVRATFDNPSKKALNILQEAGIDSNPDEPCIIQRELTSTGESRTFINNQPARLKVVSLFTNELISFSEQRDDAKLMDKSYQREILDLFGDHMDTKEEFSSLYTNIQSEKAKLKKLVENQEKNEQLLCRLTAEIDEIENANLAIDEVEQLFAEYSKLTQLDDIRSLTEIIQSNSNALLDLVQKCRFDYEELSKLDPNIKPELDIINSVHLELAEQSNQLNYYAGSLEPNPMRTIDVNQRLSDTSNLQKKYGSTIKECLNYLDEAYVQKKSLQIISDEPLKKNITLLEEKLDTLGTLLTEKRKAAAHVMEKSLVKALKALNLTAQFRTKIDPKNVDSTGFDDIEFFFTPNIGEKEISIKDCASGGELCRVSLAISSELAEKSSTSTLIFDEIDAHIGGLTALKVGSKLKNLGKKHQVICITHLAQVAEFSDHHFQISKSEKDGRTVTIINTLDSTKKQKELERMQGKI